MPESKELGPLERAMRKRLGMPVPKREPGPVTRIKNKRAEEEVKKQA